ncbi:MAG: hypothetical protein K2W82_15770 [Candidatus Obscuribacterales bacterium]|nr:hypothetical protein [Candidatus Obscuribacterales bacterium]
MSRPNNFVLLRKGHAAFNLRLQARYNRVFQAATKLDELYAAQNKAKGDIPAAGSAEIIDERKRACEAAGLRAYTAAQDLHSALQPLRKQIDVLKSQESDLTGRAKQTFDNNLLAAEELFEECCWLSFKMMDVCPADGLSNNIAREYDKLKDKKKKGERKYVVHCGLSEAGESYRDSITSPGSLSPFELKKGKFTPGPYMTEAEADLHAGIWRERNSYGGNLERWAYPLLVSDLIAEIEKEKAKK